MTPPSFSPQDQAIRVLCSKHFHQALWLPATTDHGKLRVTYSTTTNFDEMESPAILFIGPMFGTRWGALLFDRLARECGVRVICVDRPGFGGSTPVNIDIRVRVWLETVPCLLRQLDIPHLAAIMTHSAGTIYTLNTILQHRGLLDPKAPYVAFLAPWVPVAHSGATVSTIVSKLPTRLLDSWAGLSTFINTKILPSASWSGGILSLSSSGVVLPQVLSSSSSSAAPPPPAAAASSSSPPSAAPAAAVLSTSASTDLPGLEAEVQVEATTTTGTSTSTSPNPNPNRSPNPNPLVEQYGFDTATAQHIKKLLSKYQFAEPNTGANDEVKLCLRKCQTTGSDWEQAADYETCIRQIACQEATLSGSGGRSGTVNEPPLKCTGSAAARGCKPKLTVDAFFAESDILISSRGQKYFEQCWQDDAVRREVDFHCRTFAGTSHDSVLLDLKQGALKVVFERVVHLSKK